MKKLTIITMLVCIGFSFNLLVTGCKRSQEPGSENQQTGAKAKEQIKEAAKATGQYLAQQKDSFIEGAKKSYAGLQAQTSQLIADLKSDTSEKWQKTKADLDAKLQIAKEKLDELAKGSDQTWQKAQQGFNDALDKLKQAYEQAGAEFKKDENP